MRHFWVLLLVGCSEPAVSETCAGEAPAELDRSCSGDGECGDWLQCDTDRCVLPPAVSGEGGETATIDTPAATLQVEVARSDLARTRGLGARPCIEDGWGMIIEFPQAGAHQLTTESMLFDLDLAMLDETGQIIAVHENAPAHGKALYGADQPFKAVLEVPAGSVVLEVGATVTYSGSGG